MLYETLSQPLVILCIFLVGLGAGLLVDAANLIWAFCNKNKILQQILYFCCVVLSALALFYTNLNANFGRARVYIPAIFLVAFTIERLTVGKLWTKLIEKCYNTSKRRKEQRLQKDERGEEVKTN